MKKQLPAFLMACFSFFVLRAQVPERTSEKLKNTKNYAVHIYIKI